MVLFERRHLCSFERSRCFEDERAPRPSQPDASLAVAAVADYATLSINKVARCLLLCHLSDSYVHVRPKDKRISPLLSHRASCRRRGHCKCKRPIVRQRTAKPFKRFNDMLVPRQIDLAVRLKNHHLALH
jgi:hypothetical protein